jgi:hypothetical protein
VNHAPEDRAVEALKTAKFNWSPVDYVHASRCGNSATLFDCARAGNYRARQILNRRLLRDDKIACRVASTLRTAYWIGKPLADIETGVRRLGGCMLSSVVIRTIDKGGVESLTRLLGAHGRKQSILDNSTFPALSSWGLDVCSDTKTFDLLVLGGSALLCASGDVSRALSDRFQLAFPSSLIGLDQPSNDVLFEIDALMTNCSSSSSDLSK